MMDRPEGLAMNGFDIVLIGLGGFLVVVGLIKGLVRILVGIAALVTAFVLAALFHPDLAAKLTWIGPSEGRMFVAYLAIFIGTLLGGGLLAFLLRRLLEVASLGWADRLAGGALGFAMAALLAALVVLPTLAYVPASTGWLEGSRLAPYVAVVADLANTVAPAGLAERYHRGVERLRDHWRGQQRV
ncbi:MAG TPA: CvpA family protein [Candidatus Polarisedimenticolaceae bacterium]|nr:CvpA family protein [Candidatus Polarisedimenticolaceae bacterium]